MHPAPDVLGSLGRAVKQHMGSGQCLSKQSLVDDGRLEGIVEGKTDVVL